MKSTSEVGHGKNIANLEDLISQCTSFGASYNPASTNLQLANLNTLKTNADTAMLASLNAKTALKNATNSRAALFLNLRGLAQNVMLALKASGADAKTLIDANTIYKKLRGISKKQILSNASNQNNPPTAPVAKSISTSQYSFDSRLQQFTELINLLTTVSSYNPNETNLSLAGLNTMQANLQSANTNVINAYTTLSNALITRNNLLYNSVNGLVTVANDVKAYVASVFGKNSPQAKNVSKIKFRAL